MNLFISKEDLSQNFSELLNELWNKRYKSLYKDLSQDKSKEEKEWCEAAMAFCNACEELGREPAESLLQARGLEEAAKTINFTPSF